VTPLRTKKKIATIALRKPTNLRPILEVEERLKEATTFLEEAGKEQVDFVCLPEIFATQGIEKPFAEVAEKIPEGWASQFCSEMAQRYGFNLVTSLLNRRADGIYNTAVIFDRKGKLIAQYDKVHPAPDEEVLAGNQFPIFEIEGLKIGLQICFDLNYPEGCRALALQGADLIFWPTLWDGPTEHFMDCITRARAMENFLFLVPSGYAEYGDGHWRTNPIRSLSPTGILSWSGIYLAQTGTTPGVAIATIDPDEPRGLQSNRAVHFQHRRPDAYGELTSPLPQ
jgi:predicted amidohydrolase